MTTDHADHPEHSVAAEIAPGIWMPAKPLHPRGWLGIKTRRACRKQGGHWWHPELGALIDWFCCQCGAERDGMPKDGT